MLYPCNAGCPCHYLWFCLDKLSHPKSLRIIGKTKGVPMGTPFYPKSAIRACLDFDFLEEWILFGF